MDVRRRITKPVCLRFFFQGRSHSDGRRVINGLECRVRYKERLGMHSRDMYLLADALDRGSFSELVVD